MMDIISYNGKLLSEFNVYSDLSKAFGSPKKIIEYYDIEGRDGSLSSTNVRFEDIALPVPCYIRRNFKQNYRNLMAFLNSTHGYQRLESTKEPNYYRMAIFEGGVEPDPQAYMIGGQFTLNFRVNPQRWLTSGEQWVSFTADGVINNPTLQPSKPIIRMYGTGSVMIGSKTITVSTAGTSYIDFDCETQDAYEGSYNRNGNISTNFNEISLVPGDNGIDLTGLTIEIMPRWFEI